jgi:acyl carrier protein
MKEEIRDRIREVFLRFVEKEQEVDAVLSGEPILTALSIDSLTLLNLVNDLEREFNVRFDYETIESAFEDIHALAALLCQGAGGVAPERLGPDRPMGGEEGR